MERVCATPKYKCAVCGGVYDSIAQRMNCEQMCLKKKEEEEIKAAEAKKIAEYDVRVKEVCDAFKKAYDLQNKLNADYADLKYRDEYNTLDDVFKFILNM